MMSYRYRFPRMVRPWPVAVLTTRSGCGMCPAVRQGAVLAGHTGRVSSVSFSPDGQTLANGSWDDNTIVLWDVASRQEKDVLAGHTGRGLSVSFSPDGQTLASGSWDDNTIVLWDVETGQTRDVLAGHTDWVLSVSFSRMARP